MRPGNSQSSFQKRFARASDPCATERLKGAQRAHQATADPTSHGASRLNRRPDVTFGARSGQVLTAEEIVMELQAKTALINGGSSGIEARAGASVAVGTWR